MSQQVEPATSSLEATYKGRDVEGILDLLFYRKAGYRLAQLSARLGLTPVAVTAIGGIIGIFAGHLYYYRDLRINIIGMILHVVANLFDNADGQLARLLNRKSRNGRVIDSVFDHLIFLSIYVHLGLRCLGEGASPAIALLVLAAGLSHALQGAAADYFRNAYLYFVNGRASADWDSSRHLRSEFQLLSWREEPGAKLMLALYINFTWQQEFLSPKLRRLRDLVERTFPAHIPDWLRDHYRSGARPMLRWWGLLMTNTRMFFLFLFLVLDRPAWFFWMELTILNVLLAILVRQEEAMSESLVDEVAEPAAMVG